jgi:hypothetical protein
MTYEESVRRGFGGRRMIENLQRQIDSGTRPPAFVEDYKQRIAYYECRVALEATDRTRIPAPADLLSAAGGGRIDDVERLLVSGVSANSADESGRTASP